MSNSVKTKRGAYFQQTAVSKLIKPEHLGKRSFEYKIFGLSFKFEKMATETLIAETMNLPLSHSVVLSDLNLKRSELEDSAQETEVQTQNLWSAYKLTVSNTFGETHEVLTDVYYHATTYPEYSTVVYSWPKRKPRDTSRFSKTILPDFGFVSDYLALLDSNL